MMEEDIVFIWGAHISHLSMCIYLYFCQSNNDLIVSQSSLVFCSRWPFPCLCVTSFQTDSAEGWYHNERKNRSHFSTLMPALELVGAEFKGDRTFAFWASLAVDKPAWGCLAMSITLFKSFLKTIFYCKAV